MKSTRFVTRIVAAVSAPLLLVGLTSSGALAYDFTRDLHPGDTGQDVRALEVRIAGWYPQKGQVEFKVDRSFDAATSAALRAFQAAYGLQQDGIAGPQTFKVLSSLQDPDGSTAHFNFSEFKQNYNSGCSAKANAYANTFKGGMVSPRRARMYVRRLMWRLEALRAKAGGKPIGINSGFRSVAYNQCIGGASSSQHLYGDAADNRMTGVANRYERRLAMRSQFYGVGCYSYTTHNHFDLRLQNRDLPYAQFWWWPKRDKYGRDLDETGKPCWGEIITARTTTRTAPAVLNQVAKATAGAGSLVPSQREIELFEKAGEPADLGNAD